MIKHAIIHKDKKIENQLYNLLKSGTVLQKEGTIIVYKLVPKVEVNCQFKGRNHDIKNI